MKDFKAKHSMDVEVLDDLTHLTLDVIGQTAFGYNFNTILGGDSKVSKAFATVFYALDFKYLICKFLIPYFDYLPLAVNKKIQVAKEISNNTVLEVPLLFLVAEYFFTRTFLMCVILVRTIHNSLILVQSKV